MPTIPLLHNTGNYVCSLGQVVRWLGKQAEELGVDIFPGTPAAEVLYSGDAADPAAHVIGARGGCRDVLGRGAGPGGRADVRSRSVLASL